MDVFGMIEGFTYKRGKPVAMRVLLTDADLDQIRELSAMPVLRFAIEEVQLGLPNIDRETGEIIPSPFTR